MFYTVIGTQWGDEGKGKIVDWLSLKADAVVRFQGGNNAGHTLKIKDKVFKLNLLPSGIVRGKKCVIGNGVILDPWALDLEIENLKKENILIDNSNLNIAENICLILPFHKDLDEINEINRGKLSIGTTKKGIGPAYEDKVGRRSIRLCDLDEQKNLAKKISSLCSYHNIRLNHFNKTINEKSLLEKLLEIYEKIKQYSAPTWKILNDIGKENKVILFEGAQGSLLDIDFGTYPYVTSSNTISGQIFAGTGFGIRRNHKVIGITKAYTTRVGSGPFPTELNDEIGDLLASKGKEFGTVTKRKRRCGWFDAVLVKQAIAISGINEIVITKLDVLDSLDEIKICIGYDINGKKYDFLPFNETFQKKIKPHYVTIPGWKTSTYGVSNWSDLPDKAKNYINFIEQTLASDVSIISTGPERSQTIDKKNILFSI